MLGQAEVGTVVAVDQGEMSGAGVREAGDGNGVDGRASGSGVEDSNGGVDGWPRVICEGIENDVEMLRISNVDYMFIVLDLYNIQSRQLHIIYPLTQELLISLQFQLAGKQTASQPLKVLITDHACKFYRLSDVPNYCRVNSSFDAITAG